MSRVVSPLSIRLNVAVGRESKVYIALYGEDGSRLDDQLISLPTASSGQYVFAKFPFEIRAAAETGILKVITRDSTGVLLALNTVRVLLLSSGVSQINPPGNLIYERVALETPTVQSSASGGTLIVRGTYWPLNTQLLFLELVDTDGKSLKANRVLTVTGLDVQSIDTTIPYKVDSPTKAYLVIHQEDDTLKEPVYLASQQNEVLLGSDYIFTQLVTLNP